MDSHSTPIDSPLTQSLWQALRADGKDPLQLHPDDLAAVDQFHIRGKRASVELADKLAQNIDARQPLHLLDLGAGLGGSSRYLAKRFDAAVVAVELSSEYVATAQALNSSLGLDKQIQFSVGDATAIPYADQCFDAIWLQHVSMCIADKNRLFAEIFRVLKPGGVLVLQEIMAGQGGAPHFPVPWAIEPQDSYLSRPSDLLQQLELAGLNTLEHQDLTPQALQWFEKQSQRRTSASQPAALGLKLLLGEAFAKMMANQLRNFTEQRIALIQLVAQRP
ncbi:MAG: class I SAM-dependent methyltransferase [Halopseudomonas sp.]